MDYQLLNHMVNDLSMRRNQYGPKYLATVNFKKLDRIITKLIELSEACNECNQLKSELYDFICYLYNMPISLERNDDKAYRVLENKIMKHLEKVHKIVHEGYYVEIYMSIGMSLGLLFGMVIIDNTAIGLPVGLAIGISIGTALDADAKKKGKVI